MKWPCEMNRAFHLNLKKKLRILILRFSSIGDILLTTPIIRTIKSQLNAHVTFMSLDKFQFVLEHNPFIDEHISYSKRDSILDQHFDYIVDLQKNRKSYLFTRKLKGHRVTFNKKNIKKWWMVNVDRNTGAIPHIVERYFESIQSLGVEDDGLGLEYHYDDSYYKKPYRDYPYIVINCGGTYHTKRLTVSLINELIERSKIKVILLGGSDVIQLKDDIISSSNCVNLIGKTSFAESAHLIKNASLLITSDSALMHVGAALATRTAVIWGNTSPKFGMYPYLMEPKAHSDHLVSNLSCHPCSKLGFERCPKGHFYCMQKQKATEILDRWDLLS